MPEFMGKWTETCTWEGSTHIHLEICGIQSPVTVIKCSVRHLLCAGCCGRIGRVSPGLCSQGCYGRVETWNNSSQWNAGVKPNPGRRTLGTIKEVLVAVWDSG